jgi:hypothetical protein
MYKKRVRVKAVYALWVLYDVLAFRKRAGDLGSIFFFGVKEFQLADRKATPTVSNVVHPMCHMNHAHKDLNPALKAKQLFQLYIPS